MNLLNIKNVAYENQLIEITIKNFKTFSDFKIDGLAQINLISGKNNVGKTTFLESCYINLISNDIEHYLSYFIKLKNLDFSNFRNAKNVNKISINSNLHKTAVNLNNDSISIKVNGISKTFPHYEMPKLIANGNVDKSNINFIPAFPINDDSLSFLFSKIQIARKKDLLNKSLIESYYKEAKNLEYEFISFTTLVRNKENNIKAKY